MRATHHPMPPNDPKPSDSAGGGHVPGVGPVKLTQRSRCTYVVVTRWGQGRCSRLASLGKRLCWQHRRLEERLYWGPEGKPTL